jgi:hypothetical protein
MVSEFKWLCNPTKKHFRFQFDSVEYEVPAGSRKLFPATVAAHGLKASYGLSDPVISEEGDVISVGNDVYRSCHMEDADVMNPIGYSEPVIVEKSRDTASDAVALSVDPEKPLKKYVKQVRKTKQEISDLMGA